MADCGTRAGKSLQRASDHGRRQADNGIGDYRRPVDDDTRIDGVRRRSHGVEGSRGGEVGVRVRAARI